ncbi:MAG: RidA family protein [bacterium]
MPKTILNPPSAYPSKNPRSCGTRRGPFVFTAGQVAFDSEGRLIGAGDIRAQTRQAMENIRAILEEGGASLSDVMKVNIFIAAGADKEGMNEVYSQYFPEDPPARTAVAAGLASPEILIEIEAVAIVSD